MTDYLRTPDTLRDTLLGALVGLARSTSSEPKTENTDAVLNAGLRLAAQPDAPAETLQRMLDITRAEKHAVAPNCATCAMPCGNTKDYDLTRLRSAAPAVRQRKLRLAPGGVCPAAVQAAAGRVLPGCTAPGCRRAAGHLPGPVRLFRGLGRRTSGPGDRTDRKALSPVKSARRTRRIYPICFSPKYKTVSGRKSLISAGKPEFPLPGRLPERFFALQILFPAGFARFFWKKALQTNHKKLLYK